VPASRLGRVTRPPHRSSERVYFFFPPNGSMTACGTPLHGRFCSSVAVALSRSLRQVFVFIFFNWCLFLLIVTGRLGRLDRQESWGAVRFDIFEDHDPRRKGAVSSVTVIGGCLREGALPNSTQRLASARAPAGLSVPGMLGIPVGLYWPFLPLVHGKFSVQLCAPFSPDPFIQVLLRLLGYCRRMFSRPGISVPYAYSTSSRRSR